MTLSAVHVIAGLSKKYGGPSYSVPSLARHLSEADVKVTLRSLALEGPDIAVDPAYSTVLHPQMRGIYGRLTRASTDLRRALERDARGGAILHAHGLWLMPNVYPAWAKLRISGTKLVHSPRGMLALDAMKFSAWKKLPYWLLYQRAALMAADCLHATALSEYDEIRGAGLRNPVVMIPNAVDLPDVDLADDARGTEQVLLSLGRLHPKKGLDQLIHAWRHVQAEFPSWRLQIHGIPENRYDETLRSLAMSLGAERVTIDGAVYGQAKLASFRSADLFVLSSLNENFGLTVAEALAAEVPVVSTKGAPWQGLEDNRCGWWVNQGVEPLSAALRIAMSTPREERRAMGARGRIWISRSFSWAKVAQDFRELYSWLLLRHDKPETVILD